MTIILKQISIIFPFPATAIQYFLFGIFVYNIFYDTEDVTSKQQASFDVACP
jgi:hypothetical protein